MNNMTKLITVLMAVLLLPICAPLHAQDRVTVKGKVVDELGEPVIGASIFVKSLPGVGAISGNDGGFEIGEVPSDAVLVCSYIGMENVEVPVSGKDRIVIAMTPDSYLLDGGRVVSIGYGAVRKRDLTGAVASVKGEELNSFSSSSVAQALQGRLAGVEVRTTGSEPGSTMQIRIRGTNSISGGNDPLWIIDGFPGNANMINTSDIESVEVLKDASATAIYGSRGSNGVIIVTTRHAKEGVTKVDYNGSASVAFVDNKLDLLNASEYMTYQNTLQKKSVFSEEEIASAGAGTDWQDLIFNPAWTHDHSVTVTAGLNKTNVAAGLSYLGQEGIIKNSSYDKISFRTSISHDISRTLNLSAGIIYSRTIHFKQNGILSQILMATPTVSPYTEDGSYTSLRDYYSFSPSGLKNPEALVNEKEYKWTSNRTMANAALTYSPVKGLKIRGAFNANIADSRQDDYVSTKMPDSLGEIYIATSTGMHYNGEITATYTTKIKGHSISAMVGSTYEQNQTKGTAMSATGLMSDVAKTYGIASAQNIGTPSASYSKWSMLSFMGRVNYIYKDRYLATVNFRADGSSRYSVGNKWGAFPSIALAWRVSEEGFMKKAQAVNNLKLRVGYGVTGNPAISPYETLDLLTPAKTIFDKTAYTIYHPSSYYRFGLSWETTAQFNVGIDLGLFRDRLRVTADYYYKNTYDLLSTVDLPSSSGYISGTKNIGTMINQGMEIQIDARPVDIKDFKWDISANISLNRNKVGKLPDGEDVYGTKRSITIINDYINLLREGQPIGVFYGYVEDGYDDKGRIQYIDFDNSGRIDEKDKRIIGDPNPDFTFGFTTSFNYRRFSLSAYFQGSYGNDIYSLSMASLCYNYSGSKGINTMKAVLNDHWTELNPNATFPALTAAATASLKMSDRFVYDGSYLRLKNLEFSYLIPVEKAKHLSKLQVYVSAQNLWTLTSYPFYNPDVNTYGGSSSVNQGIDYFSYPLAKSVTLGLRVNF